MTFGRPFLALAVTLTLLLTASTADAAKKKATPKKKSGEKTYHGVVEAVDHTKHHFTIEEHAKQGKKKSASKGKTASVAKKGKASSGAKKKGGEHDKTFLVHHTHFVGGSFKKLHKGEHVIVKARGNHAIEVIVEHKKAKPKAKAKKK